MFASFELRAIVQQVDGQRLEYRKPGFLACTSRALNSNIAPQGQGDLACGGGTGKVEDDAASDGVARSKRPVGLIQQYVKVANGCILAESRDGPAQVL